MMHTYVSTGRFIEKGFLEKDSEGLVIRCSDKNGIEFVLDSMNIYHLNYALRDRFNINVIVSAESEKEAISISDYNEKEDTGLSVKIIGKSYVKKGLLVEEQS